MYKDVNNDQEGITGPLASIEPEIREIFLNPSADDFILVACDGLFDVFSSQ